MLTPYWSTIALSRLRRWVPGVLLVTCVACGADSEPSTTAKPAASAEAAPASTASEIAVANSAVAYFHDQLVANGEEVKSAFGSALLTLGLNPRDLQQDTPEHAYRITREKVDELKDEAMKRDMTRALFGATQAPAR